MKRRINIQYSIDESQIGTECYRLLTNSLDRLTSIAATSPKAESIMNVSTINEIKSLRTELSNIDIMLEDVNAIIDGFLNYKYVNHEEQQMQNTGPTNKQSVPDFLSMDPENIDLDQLSKFVHGLKSAQPSDYNMDEVGGLVDNSANIDPETIDQEKVQKALHDSKNLDAQQFQNQELLDMLNVFQNESGPNIDEIAKRLANLKSKVESNEVSD